MPDGLPVIPPESLTGAASARWAQALPGAAEAPPFPLRRPGALARAAQHGARLYRRSRDLPPGLGGATPGEAPAGIVGALARAEARCERERLERAPTYRPGRHVQLLAALLAEAAAAGADRPPVPAQPKASGSAALRRAT